MDATVILQSNSSGELPPGPHPQSYSLLGPPKQRYEQGRGRQATLTDGKQTAQGVAGCILFIVNLNTLQVLFWSAAQKNKYIV